jgi:hypothetical protein
MSENDKPVIVAEAASPAHANEDEFQDDDWSPLFDYLKSANGHQIASRVISLIEDVKKATIDKNYSHAKFNRGMEAAVLVVVVLAVVGLSIVDKLNPTVGVLLGSVAGYFFGKNK